MKTKPKIGIINGGGDCPGLNTVIDSIVKCLAAEYDVLGFYRGFEGLLEKQYIQLDPDFTNLFKFAGGTILKSVSKGNFPGKIGLNETSKIEDKIFQKTLKNYKDLNLECLLVLGGDGTLSVAKQFLDKGISIIGLPKSIDNDLHGTDFTFGFLTAVDIATQALDKLETTAWSHDRVMILEVMGRHAGWIALYSGIAGGANMILIPEIDFTFENILKFLNARKEEGKMNSLIIVSEGAKSESGLPMVKSGGGKASQILMGGIGADLEKRINATNVFDARSITLGHLQRGGQPNSIDRIYARQLGAYAAQMVKTKRYGRVAVFQQNSITDIDLAIAIDRLKMVDPSSSTVTLARSMGINFGDGLL